MNEKIEILLVEDTPSDIRLTEEALKRSDLTYNLAVVNDGVEAMDYLHKAKSGKLPDVVLLDLNMPKKNGHEVLQEIEADKDLKRIPIVLLTVSQRDEDVMEALRLKMNYYLAKPVTSQTLSVLLKSIHELHAKEEVADGSDEEIHVRIVLAGNPHTSPMVLGKLASDSSEKVRSRVAENANVPVSVLKTLVEDKSVEVRISAAENPNLPEELFKQLAEDSNEDVRLGLSGNRKVPVDILKLLAQDENVYVSATANKTLAEVS
jgi:FOG: CheY-like receiver